MQRFILLFIPICILLLQFVCNFGGILFCFLNMVLTIQFTPSHSYPFTSTAIHISTCLLYSYAFLIYYSMAFYFHLVKIIPSFHQWDLHLIPLQLHFWSPQLTTWTIGRSDCILVFPHSSVGKESACNAGDPILISGLGRSPGEGNNYPLQYSGLKNSLKSRTQLSNFHFQGMSSSHSFEKNKKLCSILSYGTDPEG